MSRVFTFRNKVWKDPKAEGWYFISLNNTLSWKIRGLPDKKESKLGLVKAIAIVGETSWATTLFPTKKGNYVMSIIRNVRQKEKIEDKDILTVKIEI